MSATETSLTFFNRQGRRLAGVLCVPGAAERAPAVLLCQGLSGVKHLVLPQVAARFASAGIATLRFDYAGCGESEGEAGWIDPAARIEDARYAFAFLAGEPAVDPARMGIYGHSYGGPVAITLAASERRVRAVVSVSGPGDGASLLRALRPTWDWLAFERAVEVERAALARTGVATEVEVATILPFSPAFAQAYASLKAQGGSSALESAPSGGPPRYRLASVDAMLALHPEDAARRLGGCALLLVHGEDDDVAPVDSVAPTYANAPGPKAWRRIPGTGHNDLDAGPGLARAIAYAVEWFAAHLAPVAATPGGGSSA